MSGNSPQGHVPVCVTLFSPPASCTACCHQTPHQGNKMRDGVISAHLSVGLIFATTNKNQKCCFCQHCTFFPGKWSLRPTVLLPLLKESLLPVFSLSPRSTDSGELAAVAIGININKLGFLKHIFSCSRVCPSPPFFSPLAVMQKGVFIWDFVIPAAFQRAPALGLAGS